jgi:hypothetical protein
MKNSFPLRPLRESHAVPAADVENRDRGTARGWMFRERLCVDFGGFPGKLISEKNIQERCPRRMRRAERFVYQKHSQPCDEWLSFVVIILASHISIPFR